tara:strand:+ start:2601 stop:3368 length:768 start_codon:yes stop_codon:yes gene_type:complete
MISRRLTKTQKAEILEGYKAGDNTNVLAEKFNCTPNTINRTVKTLLSESEYVLLKKKRSKTNNKNEKLLDTLIVKEKNTEQDLNIKLNKNSNSPEFEEISSLAFDSADGLGEDLYAENKDHDMLENNINHENNFEEIPPLISSFDFDLDEKKSDFEILNYESLPESVYMIVDKKVELDFKLISDLPEWSFLPDHELQRNAILLFANQRTAKRICARNQRVIKIPNTSIFKLSKSYLISKGITRLILEDSIIGLDQ